MTDPRIGSQEWRWDQPNPCRGAHGMHLATRCGISAPGRSAGKVDRVEIGYDTLWWVVHGGEMYDCENTRADAAAAAWWQEQTTINVDEERIAMRDMELTEFWRDAWRVMLR